MTEQSSSEDDLETYEVILSPTAEQVLQSIPSRADRKRIDRILCVLDTVPGIGRNYDPLYDAARPPETVQVTYAGHYGIYYEVLKEQNIVYVYYIEDQRCDPLGRFDVSFR